MERLPLKVGAIYQPSPLRGEGEGEGVLIVYKQTLNFNVTFIGCDVCQESFIHSISFLITG